MIHGGREHGKPGAGEGAEEGICRDGAVGVHEVHVNDVGQALQENHHDARADGNAGEDLRDPGDVGVRRPGEPEEAEGEEEGADDHGDEAFLGDGLPGIGGHLGLVAGLGGVGDDSDAEDDADGDAEEGEGAEAEAPAALLLEGDGVGFEEEVDHPVHEGHVERDEQEDGLEEEHLPRAVEVFGHDFAAVDAVFVEGGVDGPVFGRVPAFGRAALQDHGRVGLGAELQRHEPEEAVQDERQPGCPSPAEV